MKLCLRSFCIAVLATVISAGTVFAGSIEGVVTLKGKAPANKPINMGADKKCVALHKGKAQKFEDYCVSGDKLQWVMVSLKDAKKSSKKLPNAVIDQVGCHYVPHVLGLMVGQTLEIRNSDPLAHNIHPLPKVNLEFNISQPVRGMKTPRKFTKVETTPFKVKCNIHKWMSAYVAVYDHPFFAVSDSSGKFKINDVPAGSYTVQAWHEKLGTQTMKVTVGSGPAKANISFMAK
jgi:hypothetical protein